MDLYCNWPEYLVVGLDIGSRLVNLVANKNLSLTEKTDSLSAKTYHVTIVY